MKAAKVDEMKIGATDSTLDGLFRARNLVRHQIKEIEEDYEDEELPTYDKGWLDGLREVMDDINQEILDWPEKDTQQLSMKYPSIAIYAEERIKMTDLESSFVHENPKPETKPPTTYAWYIDGLRKAKQIVEDLLKQEEADFPDCGWMRTDKGSVPLRSEYVEGGIETLRDVLDCLEEEIERTERKLA